MPATEQDDILLTYFQRLPKVELHLHLEGAIPLLWHRASGGSWGGQRLSLADYVAGAGARGRGERRRRVLVLPTLKEALLLHAKEGQRLSWKDTFKAMTNECEDWSDLDATLNDGLDKETR
jgi:hypothetical protein